MTEIFRKAIIRCVHRRADGTIVEETEQEIEVTENGDD
mgnify:CR=1 FL=1